MVENELKKVYNCPQCGKEIEVILDIPADTSRLKCPSCRAKEANESVEKLMRVIFRPERKVN